MKNMNMYEKEIEMKIQNLPEELKKVVLDYVEFLLSRCQSRETIGKKFKFDWAGGLSKIKGKFTSVELQHKVMEWR